MTLNLNKLTASIFSIFCFGVQTLMIGQSHQKQHLNIGNLSIEIESFNGRLDGDLIVRDTLHRDKILLSGRMHDNGKIGTWTLFDKQNPDKIILQRNYSSSTSFTQNIPKPSDHQLVQLVQANLNPRLGRDSLGLMQYVDVSILDFIYSCRVFKSISKTNNALLFSPDFLLKMMDFAAKNKIVTYANESFSEVLSINPFDALKSEIIAYHIKEDFFFDKNRMLGEYRILGLAPVILNEQGTPIELAWLYFPALKPVFADVFVKNGDKKECLHDLFINRQFEGLVYKSLSFNQNFTNQAFYADMLFIIKEFEYALFFSGQDNFYLFDKATGY